MYGKINDRGSATVELCLIAPFFLLTILLFVGAFLNNLNAGAMLGRGYCRILCSDYRSSQESFEHYIMNAYAGGIGFEQTELVEATFDKGIISLVLRNRNIKFVKGMEDMSYSIRLEHEDRAIERLRRWQLYGDVLWE